MPKFSRYSSLLALAAGIVPSATAHAQDAAAPQANGDIIVTAQRRAQNLQDVGVAVTAIGGEDLQKFGVVSSKDISRAVVGVSLDSSASGGINANLVVRGVSQTDYSSNQESPNSVYIDDIYLSSSAEVGFPLYDLKRVEVLRGPQGTLFGRASSGGLANFITNRPSKAWEGYAELGYSSYNTTYAEAAVGGPLSQRIRFRVAGRVETGEGWWRNDAPATKNTFESAFAGVRGQLEADLTDALTARLSVSYDNMPRHREGTYRSEPFYVVNGSPELLPANVDAYGTGAGNDLAGYRNPNSRKQAGSFNDFGFLKNSRFSPTLNLAWDIGGATITSISNYTKFKYDYNEDCDGGPVDYCRNPLSQDLKQYSEELRVNGTTGGLTYTAGVFYLNVDGYTTNNFMLPALSGSDFAFNGDNRVTQKLESYAAFGQLEYKITDRLTATAGVRYTRDRKSFDSKLYFNELGNGYSGGTGSTIYTPPLLAYDFSQATAGGLAVRKDDLWSGKVQLDYKLNRDVLLYATISRGAKGGGFNTNVSGNLSIAQTPFGKESLYDYEGGVKLQLFDRKVRLNLSAFNYDYNNYQGFAYNGLQGVVGNYDGYFRGGEVEFSANPGYGLNINLSGSYLQSKLYDVPSIYFGMKDMEGSGAPHWTANGSASKSFDIGSNKMTVQWSGNYIGGRFGSIDNNNATRISGSFVHNARINYDLGRSGLEVSLFVNNISNVARQNFVFDLLSTSGNVIRSYDKPRWFGGSIRKTF